MKYCSIILVIALFGFFSRRVHGEACKVIEHSRKTITVWIHGTRIFPKLMFSDFFCVPRGFVRVQRVHAKYHVRKIANWLASDGPKRFDLDYFYVFGWSGKTSFSERKKAARQLYNHLNALVEKCKKYNGYTPKIRLITHSHGGNVALNLAAIKKSNSLLSIDELILLACPVQDATKIYVADEIFKRVYSFISRGDFVQVIDPQKLYLCNKGKKTASFFSQRIFPSNPKLTQACIKINGRPILHVEFLLHKFISRLPSILSVVSKNLIEIDSDKVLTLCVERTGVVAVAV